MLRGFLSCCGLVLSAPSAWAQSINVDLGPLNGGPGVPSPTYAGSAGGPGVWNRIGALSTSNLRAWDGSPTQVSLAVTNGNAPGCGGALFVSFDRPGTSGDDEKLLDDAYAPDSITVTWTFTGLAPGDYLVDTIIVCPPVAAGLCSGPSFHEVSFGGSELRYVHGDWNGAYVQGTGSLDAGTNFARHSRTVTDGTLSIDVALTSIAEYMFVSGFQLTLGDRDTLGTSLCAGDGSAGPCPCGNSGATGIGCQNSAGTGGSWLLATGATNPDSVVLHVAGELPSSLSVFLQGDLGIAPLLYGDGLRCMGGAIRRLYAKAATAGTASAPGPGDPSITARSASLGVPISPGESRIYTVAYRDPNPSYCPPAQGGTFNASNALRIDW